MTIYNAHFCPSEINILPRGSLEVKVAYASGLYPLTVISLIPASEGMYF
jgi:hypothetical protein